MVWFWVVGIVILSFILLISYNEIMISLWRKKHLIYGQKINIKTAELFVRIFGKGNITVVIETGIGLPSYEWWPIANELSKKANVVLYDRPGYGWSSISKLKRTPVNIAKELNLLLEKLNIKGPVILVGHSLGGLYMQQYARLYPEKIGGAIFLDPMTAEDNRFKAELDADVYKKSRIDKMSNIKMLHFLSRLGLLRPLKYLFLKSPPFYYYKEHTREIIECVWYHMNKPVLHQVCAEEYTEAKRIENLKGLNTTEGFPGIPIKVLYHDPENMKKELVKYCGTTEEEAGKVENIWINIIKDYLRFSERSRFVIVEESSHLIHLERKDIVVDEIFDMIEGMDNNGEKQRIFYKNNSTGE